MALIGRVRDRDGDPRLVDVAREPTARRRTVADETLHTFAARRRHDELVAFQHTDRARVRTDEARGALHDLVEDRCGIELRRQQAPGTGKLLRERARVPFGLVQPAALERAARGIGEMAREIEIVVVESPRAAEEDDDDSATFPARRLERQSEQ